jgi:hypothetical protein
MSTDYAALDGADRSAFISPDVSLVAAYLSAVF